MDHRVYDYTCGAAQARSIAQPVADPTVDALDARFMADPTARPARPAMRLAR